MGKDKHLFLKEKEHEYIDFSGKPLNAPEKNKNRAAIIAGVSLAVAWILGIGAWVVKYNPEIRNTAKEILNLSPIPVKDLYAWEIRDKVKSWELFYEGEVRDIFIKKTWELFSNQIRQWIEDGELDFNIDMRRDVEEILQKR